nr:PREDICTED: protein abrupt-like isoform X3 [Bemisia tabaci]
MGGLAGPEQQYSLRWNDYHASILSSFRHLRDEEDFVDVTLACDGRSFTAHKVVLSACSPYFRTLLKANPCQHPIVILRDVREQDMKALLKFMYNGEVHIGEEQLPDFLKTAQTLQVRGLADVPGKEHPKFNPSGPNPVPWSVPSAESRLGGDEGMTPPPVKRSRSSDHMTSPSPSTTPNNISTPNNNNNNIESNQNNNCRDLILSQALENPSQLLNNSNMTIKLTSESSLHAHSTGEDSNSSDTELSERGHSVTGDGVKSEPNSDFNDHGSHPMDHARPPPNFPAALLGLQGLPGLLPGPSGMHGNNQDSNFGPSWMADYGGGSDFMGHYQSTPSSMGPQKPVCPECGKVYSNNSNLKQHIANVHAQQDRTETCYVCHKQFKTKQYLQVHLLASHGIRQRNPVSWLK